MNPDELLEMYDTIDADDANTAALADWLRKETGSAFAQSLTRFYDDKGFLTPKQIAVAESMRRDAAPATRSISIVGTYLYKGDIYRIYTDEGRPRGQKMQVTFTSGEGLMDHGVFWENDDIISVPFKHYRITLDQAVVFGQLVGICCCCGRPVDDTGVHESCEKYL